MALEQKYFTEGKNDNLKLVKRMTRSRIRNMYSTREHGTGHVFCFVCRLLYINS